MFSCFTFPTTTPAEALIYYLSNMQLILVLFILRFYSCCLYLGECFIIWLIYPVDFLSINLL